MRTVLGMLAGLLLLQGAAHAGRRPFLYSSDVTTVPEGDVELETWLDYFDRWRFWVGPRWSPFDGVEVMALTSFQQDEGATSALLWAELVQGRWRSPATTAGSLILELDFRIAIAAKLPHQIQPQVGWVKRAGRLVGTAEVGYAHGFEGVAPTKDYDWFTWRGGAAFDVIRGEVSAPLQLGVEAFGEAVINGLNDLNFKKSTANLGPTLSVARGRLWFTGGILFGLTSDSPDTFVRGIIGLAL
jgi:hypothetical protein